MFPQRKHKPKSMQRWCLRGVSLPSGPKMERAVLSWAGLLEGGKVQARSVEFVGGTIVLMGLGGWVGSGLGLLGK